MKAADTKKLRAVFGKFATGVTVVTFEREGEIFGMTVNSFSSVSLDPPMVLFCPALGCRFSQKVEVGGLFTVSILAEDQKDVCLHFAGRPNLPEAPWSESSERPPVIKGALAHFRCKLEALHEHGDHYVAIGRVSEAVVHSESDPLLFFSGNYPTLNL